MIRKFVHDMIYMTEGEKLVYYWPLWLVLIVVCVLIIIWQEKKK